MKVREIVIIGLISALNIGSRLVLQPLPNIKPVTTIILLCGMILGMKISIGIAIVTTLVSGMLLGLGTFIPFQILAWVIVAFAGSIIGKLFEKPNVILMALFSGFCGFMYGFFVSLDKLIIAGLPGFLSYYVAGLPFDCLHAVGNIVFYFIFYPILTPILKKEKLKLNELKN